MQHLFQLIKEYLDTQKELVSLEAKAMVLKIVSFAGMVLLIFVLMALAVSIFLITLALILNELLQSVWMGFGIVFLILCTMIIFAWIWRTHLRYSISNLCRNFLE